MTYLQQVHAIRFHTIHPLADSLLHDLWRHFRWPENAPLCCANDFDFRSDIFDSSTLTTIQRGENKGRGRKREATGLEVNQKCFRRGCNAQLSQIRSRRSRSDQLEWDGRTQERNIVSAWTKRFFFFPIFILFRHGCLGHTQNIGSDSP